jgi:cation-transporting ATPase I
MVGAAVVGRGAVLGARQILAINLVTDVLPAVAVAVQPPLERDLQRIAREGTESFDQRLRQAILRRGAATAVPALAAVLAAPLLGAQAPVVAFGSIIITQLAQTLRSDELQIGTSRPVAGAVAASGGVLAASLALPPLRNFLGLPPVGLRSVLLIGAAAPSSLLLARALRRCPGSAPGKLAGVSVALTRQTPRVSGAEAAAAADGLATQTPSTVS